MQVLYVSALSLLAGMGGYTVLELAKLHILTHCFHQTLRRDTSSYLTEQCCDVGGGGGLERPGLVGPREPPCQHR